MPNSFDQPLDKRRRTWRTSSRLDSEATGIVAERIARFTGTPKFIIWLSLFVAAWLAWNSFAPERLRFDSASLGFTALTLMLSLQASYASPLILLAQNRQDERDRVSAEQDRQHAMRTLADTEFLTREIASLRMSMQELASRDFVRSEMRDQFELREQINQRDAELALRDQKIAELEERLARFESEN
ncbi:DUF1003 domain-containing protein [Trueperella pecoris]|uniref:DUF1003 domain-containing protein n=1 Tax=Trueperella pecoris TaxID=2733571 RepID=A0A7M1QS80_9ACTO|nr:DUF1003 domain-containing protein [Trueperella pecoris]QOR45012.1 DUF1003 domain-containing protein [Trueperella pecoris]QTG74912.1 DUF1003 domain-containing protein [Trueperella pecoris]